MNRPNFDPVFTKKSDYCEKCSSVPVKTFVPHQSIALNELISRFEHGQRLCVHENFPVGSNFINGITDDMAQEAIRREDINSDDFPPYDVHDVTDVQELYNAHQERKREYVSRKKKEKQAQQAQQQKPAQQAKQDPAPSDPPVA